MSAPHTTGTVEIYTQRRVCAGALDARGALDPRRPSNGQAGRVLIVDDDPALRLLCAVNLTAEGLHVLEAEDGLDALEQARRERSDLVLTDVKMPGLDGFQLAARLRRDERTRPNPVDLPERRGRAGKRGTRPRARRARLPDQAV